MVCRLRPRPRFCRRRAKFQGVAGGSPRDHVMVGPKEQAARRNSRAVQFQLKTATT